MQDPDKHRRYFQIAGITACVQSDLDFDAIRFKPELAAFAVDNPGGEPLLRPDAA